MKRFWQIFSCHKGVKNPNLYLYRAIEGGGSVTESFDSLGAATEAAKKAAAFRIDEKFYIFKAVALVSAEQPSVYVDHIVDTEDSA